MPQASPPATPRVRPSTCTTIPPIRPPPRCKLQREHAGFCWSSPLLCLSLHSTRPEPFPRVAMNAPLFDVLDVSNPGLYRDDAWREPFAAMRRDDPVHRRADSPYGPYWSVTRYADIM